MNYNYMAPIFVFPSKLFFIQKISQRGGFFFSPTTGMFFSATANKVNKAYKILAQRLQERMMFFQCNY